jgi:tetratricopeptide (TPR) repeat protein
VQYLNELADYYHINEPEKSLDLSGKALIISKRRSYYKGEALADINIAQVQMTLGNYISASEYVYEALRIYEKLEDKPGIAAACNYIGTINYHLGNFESALEYLYRAVKLNFELKDYCNLASVYNSIGVVYADMENNQQAISLYKKALKLNRDINHKERISDNYGNLGESYLNNDDPISLDYFRKKLAIENELESVHGIASAHKQIGTYYQKNNITDSALYYYETGYELAKDVKSLPLRQEILQGLARAYTEVDQFGAATHYYEELLVVMDSLRTEQSINTISKLEMQYNLDKLLAEHTIRNKETEQQYIIIGAALVFLILLIGASLMGQRRKVRHVKLSQEHLELEKKHLNDQLEYKDKELTTNVMYQVKKNEMLSCVVDKLIKSKYRFKKENHPIIEEITRDIQSTLKEDIWEEFELRFKEVHRDFYENLHKEFGELTPNEKKLCAFIRLGLTTKEIATITHQNPNTIEVARTRLRKKLRISNKDVNLVSFLSKY